LKKISLFARIHFPFFLFFIVFFSNTNLSAQENDQQLWAMMIISKNLGSKYFTSVTLINRINDNISRYSDISVDWRIRRKIKNGWSAQIAFRHWTFTERKPVYFFWYDLINVQKQENFRWVNLLRIHHGLDWVGKEQADFLRWRNHYFQNIKNSKLVPFLGYDLWFRFNNRNAFQNLWLEADVEYKQDKIKYKLFYRRISVFKDQPGWKKYVIVAGIF